MTQKIGTVTKVRAVLQFALLRLDAGFAYRRFLGPLRPIFEQYHQYFLSQVRTRAGDKLLQKKLFFLCPANPRLRRNAVSDALPGDVCAYGIQSLLYSLVAAVDMIDPVDHRLALRG